MPKSSVRIVLNRPSIKRFLQSDDVAALLDAPAERVRARADEGIPGGADEENFHLVTKQVGHDRASVTISAKGFKAQRAEQEKRNLTKALEAGRG